MLGSQSQTQPKSSLRSSQSDDSNKVKAKASYFLTWRWHFYAGLFVIPFMLMLSLTGLVMLFDDEIEQARYSEIITVAPQAQTLPPSIQLRSVKEKYPDSQITQFVASESSTKANRFNVRHEDGKSVLVTVNPYSGEVLGEIDRSDSWYQLANDIHGTLLIGQSGDYLIEVSASLGILLLVSGIYLWLPKDNATKAGFLKVRIRSGSRVLMRDLHANLGGTLSIVLLLFLLSGLAWAGVWGAKMVQGWNTFPTYYTWGEKPESSLIHADLNHGSEEEMPWNLELAAVPESQGHHGGHHEYHSDQPFDTSHSVGIDSIVSKATSLGFTQFKVYLPQSETGVYTVSANSMAGDVTDPRKDRTTHFDQYTGEVLVDVTWDDYNVVAKLMAAGVSLHQGDLSIVNKLLNVLFCLAFIVISVTGALMWWVRRPTNQNKLGVPARFEQEGIWKVGAATIILVSVLFPLAGVTIISVLILDTLLVKRSPKLKAYLS
ncbi:PepSY-associated TM helix domain-containing protein [Vibrio europaeus]|uniref:PepSY-associated TM helix domain-containing protein n=1 Tax=Vibrio europaeus TaxID=300876 RepID=UPI0039DFFD91